MFTLDQVVPWGRSFEEYQRMFALSEADLSSRILGCGDGPASFNAIATRRGARVVSIDPLYRFPPDQIRARIDATATAIAEQLRGNQDAFVWDTFTSVDDLLATRLAAMATFLDDYAAGANGPRYVDAELPRLPLGSASFDLTLCSHLLFLYTDQLTESFHHDAVAELCRVAPEVRIFPLVTLEGRPSPYVAPVSRSLRDSGYDVSVEVVPYEFQRGGNQMMRVRER